MIFKSEYLIKIFHLVLTFTVFSYLHASNASFTASRVIRCLPEESSALLQLKSEFSFSQESSVDGDPKMKDWKAGDDCCEWDGVTCNTATGHVVGLDLSSSWLQGPLLSNSSLFLLHRLQQLNLADNDFNYSQIPSTFGQLSRLIHLNLSFSALDGLIPFEISGLTNLISLDLSRNSGLYLTRSTLFENMTKLSVLQLFSVDLSSLQAETLLVNSSSLTDLSLTRCDLNGKFPEHFLHLPKIESIDLSYNRNLTGFLPKFPVGSKLKSLLLYFTKLSGRLPNSIGNLKFLNILDLSYCHFSGAIPASLWNLSQLTSLIVPNNNLNGQLPSTLGNLSQLNILDLSANNFNGQLPSTIGNIYQLTDLDLSTNNFNGQLPSTIGNLSQLNILDLSANNFNGQLPSAIGNLYQLIELYMSTNNFNGQLPSSIGNLADLAFLDLSSSGFSGELLSSLGNLTLLYSLKLGSNYFSGKIPSSFRNLNCLTSLDLHKNEFYGKFPIPLTNLTQLYSLDLSYNQFTGCLPPLDHLDLTELSLSNNLFTGAIPSSLLSSSCVLLSLDNNNFTSLPDFQNSSSSNMYLLNLSANALQGSLVAAPPSTEYFFISNNNWSGSLPLQLCNLTDLIVLDMSNNNFGGIIPQCLGSFSNSLEVLNMQGNNFLGKIPRTFFKAGNKLKTLDLSHNQIRGNIPQSLINCRALEVLNLGYNQISDTFPFWLQDLSELQVLVLRSNKFCGPIWHPHKFFGFVKLRIVDLSFNNFSGALPSEYFRNWNAINKKIPNATKSILRYMKDEDGYYQDSVTVMNKGLVMEFVKILTIFTSIDLSNNNFHGEIPTTMGDLMSLIVLNLSGNNFQGHIPSSFGSLTELESLDLSNNKLSGKIPQELASLTFLEYLNLSDNQLEGPIPHGQQFDTFTNSSFEGNLDLCGLPLSKKCESISDGTPTPDHEPSQEDDSEIGFGWKVVLLGYGCGFVVGAIGGHVLFSKKPNWFTRIYGRKM